MNDPALYRPCAGIMLVNASGHIFVGQRRDTDNDAWQMPQGGIDKGEAPDTAAIRELEEETGIRAHLVSLITRTETEYFYDLPPHLQAKMWGGKYRGQRQRWFLFRFSGVDSDINIETAHPEFRAWRWAARETLVDLIVPFKRELYRDVLAEFTPHF